MWTLLTRRRIAHHWCSLEPAEKKDWHPRRERYSRVEDRIIVGALVVPVELVETAGKGCEHEEEDEEELGNVNQHAAQRDLQWAQMLVRLQWKKEKKKKKNSSTNKNDKEIQKRGETGSKKSASFNRVQAMFNNVESPEKCCIRTTTILITIIQ